ncbi:TetR/AcrR family transcriptional regulator [Actinacidiphila sp. ITFR-21]|uniref:TetR/AcrR family transcriptional regulator n=1 Tax=Actinacidiphila sp. ITFR-21 TaxID=3075199 RepID=UPI00288B492C|nr:TetR/AcrR family transcriptional regulator C-terminal domain-containing protein [Streptomyces sp. ITFR-21]WNI18921.1 TetR/AcrR family transcriptional regulator C-terminal domain-containing protein [Streptomyces sp. ITFR-21]
MTSSSEPIKPRRLVERPGAGRGMRTPRLGRPPQVDREAIVRAAVAVGFGQIGMTSVAQHLGIKHSTLYRYFATRDALVSAAVDAVVAEADWPEPGDQWRRQLSDHAWATFRLLERHSGLAAQIVSLSVDSAAYGEVSHRTVTALVDLGFAPEDAILAYDLVHEQVLMFFLAGQRRGEPARTPDEAARMRREMLPDALPKVDPRLREALAGIVTGSPGDWFARKLDVLLDGLGGLAPGG